MRPHRSRAQAFTLIELLACIGIISLLIGILLATLLPTREAARDKVCRSNLRQLHNATFARWVSEGQNWLPMEHDEEGWTWVRPMPVCPTRKADHIGYMYVALYDETQMRNPDSRPTDFAVWMCGADHHLRVMWSGKLLP